MWQDFKHQKSKGRGKDKGEGNFKSCLNLRINKDVHLSQHQNW